VSDAEGGRSGVGPFLAGLAIGAALGALFAPESGSKIRARLGRRAGRLREDLGEVVDELRTVMALGEGGDGSPRDALRERLAAARAGRAARRAPALPAGGESTEDTPLA